MAKLFSLSFINGILDLPFSIPLSLFSTSTSSSSLVFLWPPNGAIANDRGTYLGLDRSFCHRTTSSTAPTSLGVANSTALVTIAAPRLVSHDGWCRGVAQGDQRPWINLLIWRHRLPARSSGLIITYVGMAKIMGVPFREGPCLAREMARRQWESLSCSLSSASRRAMTSQMWITRKAPFNYQSRNSSADASHMLLPCHAPQLLTRYLSCLRPSPNLPSALWTAFNYGGLC